MTDLLDAIRQASGRGWRICLTIDGLTDVVASADRGDCNCPHDKPYSKNDGHGYERVEEAILDSFDALTKWILALEDYKQ
jgi:hypothetical protein